jgi:hypothetical protein
MIYDSYRLIAPDSQYYEACQLDFESLFKTSVAEDMKPLDATAMQKHPFSMAMVGIYWTPHHVQKVDVLSYAGVTGFEEYRDKKLAVVGSFITPPPFRHAGHSLGTVDQLLEIASTPEAIIEHGHAGFMARCNTSSERLTKKLGFSEAGRELGKVVMVRMF